MVSFSIDPKNHGHVMPDTTLFAQVLDRANRADPFPLYARLCETPVVRENDGTYTGIPRWSGMGRADWLPFCQGWMRTVIHKACVSHHARLACRKSPNWL